MKHRILTVLSLVFVVVAMFIAWQEMHSGASVNVEENLSRAAALKACPAVALTENDYAVMEALFTQESVQQAMKENHDDGAMPVITLDFQTYLPEGAEFCDVSVFGDNLYLVWQERKGRQRTILNAVQTEHGMELIKTIGIYSGDFIEEFDRYENYVAIYENQQDEIYTRYTEQHRFFAWLPLGKSAE